MTNYTNLSDHDVSILRALGAWQAQAVETEANREKIAAWKRHDAGLPGSRVMVIAEALQTTTDTKRSVNDADLHCHDPWARSIEWSLRARQFEVEKLRDDHFTQPWIEYAPQISCSDYGVPSGIHRESGANAFSFQYHAPLRTLDEDDFACLHPREFHWDRAADARECERLTAIFAGILPVRRRLAGWQLAMPMTSTVINFVGLDNFMLLLFDNPQGIHRLMQFIRDDYLAYLRFFDENHLFTLNNEGDYIGSGCMGCTDLLPADDYAGQVRPKDLWYFCESQESVGISPDQYGEFVFPYLSEIAGKFGRVYYGCCEGVHPFWPYLRTLPNLQRVSVSAWADEERMGAYCRERNIVYSRKPSPNFYISAQYDEAAVRDHLEKTVTCAEYCRLEFIQRDVLTTYNEPERFIRWVELVREVGARHHANPLSMKGISA